MKLATLQCTSLLPLTFAQVTRFNVPTSASAMAPKTKTIYAVMWVNNVINYPFRNGLHHLFVVIWGVVYGIVLPTLYTTIWESQIVGHVVLTLAIQGQVAMAHVRLHINIIIIIKKKALG
jgi:hypothetical protein